VKAPRLAVALGLLATQGGCGEPSDYGEAVECAAWFKVTQEGLRRHESRLYRGWAVLHDPGWAVLHARKIGGELGKTRRQIDAELVAAVRKARAQPQPAPRQLKKDIDTSGTTANRCWFTYN
jgi:hypothetical protein